LTDPSSVLDDVGVEAASLAILARGPPAPFSPSSLFEHLNLLNLLPRYTTTLLPFDLLPAITQTIGVGEYNRALGKGSPGTSGTSIQARNHQAMFDRVAQRRGLNQIQMLLPIVGMKVRGGPTTTIGRRRLPAAGPGAFLDFSIALLIVGKGLNPTNLDPKDYRVLVQFSSSSNLFSAVCASRGAWAGKLFVNEGYRQVLKDPTMGIHP